MGVVDTFGLRVPYCVLDAGYGFGRSLGDCRPALPKGQKYQMVKTQTVPRSEAPSLVNIPRL